MYSGSRDRTLSQWEEVQLHLLLLPIVAAALPNQAAQQGKKGKHILLLKECRHFFTVENTTVAMVSLQCHSGQDHSAIGSLSQSDQYCCKRGELIVVASQRIKFPRCASPVFLFPQALSRKEGRSKGNEWYFFWRQVQFLLLIQWCKAYTDTAHTGEGGVRKSTSHIYVRGKIESLSQFGFRIEQNIRKVFGTSLKIIIPEKGLLYHTSNLSS